MVSGGFQFDADAAVFVAGAAVPLTDRGFRYGMMVFETLLVRKGRLVLLAEHARLLERGAHECGLRVPPSNWPAAAERLVNGFSDGVLRVYLTAGDGSPLAPAQDARLFAAFEPMEVTFGSSPPESRGTRVSALLPDLPWVKTGNYWPWIRAAAVAQTGKSQVAVLVDGDGFLCSGAMGNFFAVINGRLVTPPAGNGVRPGAVREWIISRFHAAEDSIAAADLHGASECFLSNSRVPVQMLTAIDGVEFPGRTTSQEVWRTFQSEVLNEES
jgi:branched-subunit amino acid aminotransferase/4-amino-4-deoxychorismate lyase